MAGKRFVAAVETALNNPAVKQLVVRGLIEQRAQIDDLIRAFGGPVERHSKPSATAVVDQAFAHDATVQTSAATNGRPKRHARIETARRPKRTMSAATRKKMSDSMRRRWREARREGKTIGGHA